MVTQYYRIQHSHNFITNFTDIFSVVLPKIKLRNISTLFIILLQNRA